MIPGRKSRSRRERTLALALALLLSLGSCGRQRGTTVGEHRPANRLAGESSPYLLLHAHDPVDWYPWGEEAFARAQAGGQADLPLGRLLELLLVPRHGARGVLETPTIAALMNR